MNINIYEPVDKIERNSLIEKKVALTFMLSHPYKPTFGDNSVELTLIFIERFHSYHEWNDKAGTCLVKP